jgi:hypothetical protein
MKEGEGKENCMLHIKGQKEKGLRSLWEFPSHGLHRAGSRGLGAAPFFLFHWQDML